jgi:spore germination cell wall hydrolase CwlJ-like protein
VILAPWQFSCWNDADPNRIYMLDLLSKHPTHDGVWQQAQWVAEGIILGKILDNVHGSEHYMTRAVYDVGRPKWANSMSIVAEIGHHVFLK